jgi:hypothetical protein
MKIRSICVAVVAFLLSGAMTTLALAAGCGWDVHAMNFETFELSKTDSLLFYTGQATVVMDDIKDPRHLTSGICRGMGAADGDKLGWSGACWWADASGDRWVVKWAAHEAPKPGEPLKGVFKVIPEDNTGKFKALSTKGGTWTGLPKGGSRFCDD